MAVTRIALLGSTGSIGTQTLDVARMHPDKVQVVALAAAQSAWSSRPWSLGSSTWPWETSVARAPPAWPSCQTT